MHMKNLYHPITATPFKHNASYMELAPCPALRPYIRCFWGSTEPVASSDAPGLVIPDTCMDIIFRLDYTRQTIVGSFCAMDERAYLPRDRHADRTVTSTFAIRFYAWTASLFTEHPLTGSKNQVFAVGDFFSALEKELKPMLMSVASLNQRAEIASRYLMRRLDEHRMNSTLMNAVHQIICARGAMKIADLAARNAVSRKRLERVFDEYMGLSPKSFSSLTRYQLLWQELCFGQHHDMLDLVEKYGYFDQSHLLNDFKHHHTLTPSQAVRLARADVAFLQDILPGI